MMLSSIHSINWFSTTTNPGLNAQIKGDQGEFWKKTLCYIIWDSRLKGLKVEVKANTNIRVWPPKNLRCRF